MKRRLSQWLLYSLGITAIALIALLLLGKAGTGIADAVLAPWFAICEAITPQSWQTRGNTVLGLLWIVSGFAVIGTLAGAAIVGSLTAFDRLRARNR